MTASFLEQAKKILNDNWTGKFTKPAPQLYPHQWNWDSGFIALGYSHYDLQKAQAELEHLFQGQWKNGMLPQIIFRPELESDGKYFPGADFWQTEKVAEAPDEIITSGITMPPVHGFILWHLYINSGEDQRLLPFLKKMFFKVEKLHQYLYSFRDPVNEGLVLIRHPWESGTDNSPVWDSALQRMKIDEFDLPAYERADLQNKKAKAHRPTNDDYDRYVFLVDLSRKNNYEEHLLDKLSPFKIQDPLFNAILNYSNECMAKLATVIGEDGSQFDDWFAQTRAAFNNKLWNRINARYDAYDLVADELIENFSCNSLLPLLSGIPDPQQAQRMIATMLGPQVKNEDMHLCPSYALNKSEAELEKYWRGPIWININWLLAKGCQRYGFVEEAEQLKKDALGLIEQYGFYEYFDPRKNLRQNGYGTGSFSWSAALYIDLIKAN